MRFEAISLLLAAGLLSACADPSQTACDRANRDINLATLMSNNMSGTYDQCLRDLKGELAALQLESRSLDQRAAALNAQAQRLSGQNAAMARQLAQVNATQAELARKVVAAGNGGSSAETAALVDREKALRTRLEALTVSSPQAQADTVTRDQDALARQLDRLGV